MIRHLKITHQFLSHGQTVQGSNKIGLNFQSFTKNANCPIDAPLSC